MTITPGVITSPNHPGKYPDNIVKVEHVTVETGKILRLEFTAFAVHVVGSISTCTTDFVRITDGDGTTLMDNSCGYSDRNPSYSNFFQPPIITSLTNTVEIYFHTDDEGAQPGWSLDWTALAAGGCLNILLLEFYSSANDLLKEGLSSLHQSFQSHLVSFIHSVHIAQAQSVPPQSLQHLANPALSSLELLTVNMFMKSTIVAAVVIKTSLSLVFLTTQPLVFDSGR